MNSSFQVPFSMSTSEAESSPIGLPLRLSYGRRLPGFRPGSTQTKTRAFEQVGPEGSYAALPLPFGPGLVRDTHSRTARRRRRRPPGDGSGRGSFVGSAQLVTSTPFAAGAPDYAAWIVVESRELGLGFPVPFHLAPAWLMAWTVSGGCRA